LTPEERAAICKELGIDDLPASRYDDVPEEHPPVTGSGLMTYKKVLALIDPLATAAFEKFIPAHIVVDQSFSAREFHPFLCKAISFRTDLPVPSNDLIYRSTGVPAGIGEKAWYPWLAVELQKMYDGFGAQAISPPLLWRTNGYEGTVPLIGFIVKLDIRPKAGETLEDTTASMGLLAPPDLTSGLDSDQKHGGSKWR
jgi:hypothetical protein